MTRRSDEYKLQVAVVKELRDRGVLVFAVPNERNAGISDALRMRASGLTKGVPDLMVYTNTLHWWLELKTPTGVRSPEQKAFESLALQYGVGYRVVRSLDDIKDIR